MGTTKFLWPMIKKKERHEVPVADLRAARAAVYYVNRLNI